MRKERQAEGIAATKARGVYKGRKPKIDAAVVSKLRYGDKLGPAEIARRSDRERGKRIIQMVLDQLLDLFPATRWRDECVEPVAGIAGPRRRLDVQPFRILIALVLHSDGPA